MSLPPGFLDELRTRLSMGQVAGRKVIWDQRKSNQGKGDLWAPCPFHQEKTASFHVDDRKGFYYCFGCHAKGDAISFVRETENVSFMEAIKILADEAGMQVPQSDPKAQEKADERTLLSELMEQAVQHFRLNLQTAAGADARDYLARRGLDGAAQDRWGIGYAPRGWEGLRNALTAKGATPEMLLKVGLVKASDKGRAPYDTFRDRIMFPIRDARGRAIAFGGRALDPNDNAKYLNSPETVLFDKSRTLYNVKPAREAAGKGQPLIVAEGYMDVIALSEAGFQAAVAPLGTAVTEHHLRMLWRIAPEPIIALDGDTAGVRAAMRTIDIALPLLEAGQSLRFALMPEGLDPDDVLKQQGKGAMQKLLDGAIPMVQLLWQRETDGKTFDSPERKAALDKALREKIKLIADPSIRAHYGQAIKDMRWQLFSARKTNKPARQKGNWTKGGTTWDRERMPRPSAKSSSLAQGVTSDVVFRENRIFANLLTYPALVEVFEPELERLQCDDREIEQIRHAMLRHLAAPDLRGAIEDTVGADVVAGLLDRNHLRIMPWIGKHKDDEQARLCVADDFNKIFALRGYSEELRDGQEEITGVTDENLTWRLARAAEALDPTAKALDGDNDADFDVAGNGAKLSREERGSFSDLLSRITIEKSGRDTK